MELALITVKQVVVLFILIFAGFVCVKTKAVKMEGKKAFSDLLLYLIVPAMVINSYMMEFNIDILHNLLKAFELSILLLLIGLFITLALTAKHKKSRFADYAVCLHFFQCGIYGISTDSGAVWLGRTALCECICDGL